MTAPVAGQRRPSLLRRWALDLAPLRHSRSYRRFVLGSTVSTLGTQVTLVAVPLQVFALTGSSLSVGLIGLFALVPLIGFGLVGGAIADSMDRRRLVTITSSGLMLVALALVVQAALDLRQVWLLYAIVAVQSALFAVDSPARGTVEPRLLPLPLIPAAQTIRMLGFNVGVTGGPLLAGLLVFGPGLTAAYAVDALTFVVALWAVRSLPAMPPDGGGTKLGLASVLEGLAFLRTRRVLLMTFLVDLNAMVFGMPRALFPALAATTFGGDARTAGLLYAAPAIGALVGGAFSGGLGRVQRQGVGVLLAVALWGLAITGFGLTSTLWLACVLLAVAGFADLVSAVYRSTILQAATPDHLRGRLQGVFIVVVAGGPRLGDVESGGVAAVAGPEFSVVSGGLACLAGVALLAACVPSFARYDAREPHA